MSTNARTDVQNAKTRENAQRKGELEAIRDLMQTPVRRALVHRLLDMTGVDRSPAFSPSAMGLAHDHGVREVGYFLLSEIREACPEQELVMRKEAIQRAKRADLEMESRDND